MLPSFLLFPVLILIGSVFVLVAIVAHWLVVDHLARRRYALRTHNREHAFQDEPGCRFCERRSIAL